MRKRSQTRGQRGETGGQEDRDRREEGERGQEGGDREEGEGGAAREEGRSSEQKSRAAMASTAAGRQQRGGKDKDIGRQELRTASFSPHKRHRHEAGIRTPIFVRSCLWYCGLPHRVVTTVSQGWQTREGVGP